MDLIKYITDIEQLEKEKLTLEYVIKQLDSAISQFERPRIIQRDENPIDSDTTGVDAIEIMILTTAIAWSILGLTFLIIKPQFSLFICLIFLLPSIAAITKVILDIVLTKRMFKINEAVIDKKYTEDLKNEEIRFEREKEYAIQYKNAIDCLRDAHSKTCNLLKKLYLMNYIEEKYQYDLIAICTFSEYFKSGRCSVFDGYNGAYNIYENKIRMGVIISDLDTATKQWDKLRTNQYELYTILNEINNKRNKIVANLKKLSQNDENCLTNAEYTKYYHQILSTIKTIEETYQMCDI